MLGLLRSDLVRALLLLLFGICLLDGMAAFIKLLLPRYTALELSAYRNIVGMIPAFVMMYWSGDLSVGLHKLWIPQWKLAFARGVMVTLAQLFYYIALGNTEFAMVAALGYTMSLFVVVFSIPVLGEKVGLWRSIAVAMGFAGAMWIVRPGAADFSLIALLPLAAAAFYAMSIVTVRLVDRNVSNALLYLYSAASAAVVSIAMVLGTTGFGGIASWPDALMILCVGLLGGCGVLCLLIAVRMVEPSLLAPFNYFGLFSAFSVGWLVFGEAPFDKLFPGVLLIVAGGFLVLWREGGRAAVPVER